MVYKIRIVLDAKEDIFRDIEIKAKQTLWNMHLGIKSAFSLPGDELSEFNLLEEDGTVFKSVPLEDMSEDGDGEIMSDVYIDEVFESIGDKAHFEYGLLDLWEFYLELIEIIDEKPAVNYPFTVYRFGNVPLKAPKKSGSKTSNAKPAKPVMDLDFDDDFSSFETNASFEDDDDDYSSDDDDFQDDNFYDDADVEEEEEN